MLTTQCVAGQASGPPLGGAGGACRSRRWPGRARAGPGRGRSIRVCCLVAAIVAMSVADLVITMTYARSVGMGEMNPLARYIMEHGSRGALVSWKCASIGLASLVFIRHRRRTSTEIACWFALAVLVWLLVRWSAYSDEARNLTPALHMMPEAEAGLWVRMRD